MCTMTGNSIYDHYGYDDTHDSIRCAEEKQTPSGIDQNMDKEMVSRD